MKCLLQDAGYAAYQHPLSDDSTVTPSKPSSSSAAAAAAAEVHTPCKLALTDACKITDEWLLPSSDIIPCTFTMSLPSDRLAFLDAIKDSNGDAWVVKPPSSNQGKGISITADTSVLEQIASRKSTPAPDVADATCAAEADAVAVSTDLPSPALPRLLAPISKSHEIVQRYIANPMLLPQQRKFDLRVFMLWAKAEPTVVYWHPGYARACIDQWQPIVAGAGEVNKFAHLTNLAVAKVRHVDDAAALALFC
jgi:hypothetical protein